MKDRVPTKRDSRPALPTFSPVPRQCKRHDGWTPERQKAFIEALADTGSVSRAAAMVNMATEGAYMLRRAAGAEEFRRAWEAALDFGVARMKDIAFERAVEGQMVPMIAGGKLIGWRRIYNDRLLMFCLRHYGEDSNGKRTKIEYFSTRAAAGAVSSEDSPSPQPLSRSKGRGAAIAEASTTTVRTVISGPSTSLRTNGKKLDSTSDLIEGFAGVELDEEAKAAILAVLTDCAARRRAIEGTADDPEEPFVAARQPPLPPGPMDRFDAPVRRPPSLYPVDAEPEDMVELSPRRIIEPEDEYQSGPDEMRWQMLDDEEGMRRIEDAVASVRAAKSK